MIVTYLGVTSIAIERMFKFRSYFFFGEQKVVEKNYLEPRVGFWILDFGFWISNYFFLDSEGISVPIYGCHKDCFGAVK